MLKKSFYNFLCVLFLWRNLMQKVFLAGFPFFAFFESYQKLLQCKLLTVRELFCATLQKYSDRYWLHPEGCFFARVKRMKFYSNLSKWKHQWMKNILLHKSLRKQIWWRICWFKTFENQLKLSKTNLLMFPREPFGAQLNP